MGPGSAQGIISKVKKLADIYSLYCTVVVKPALYFPPAIQKPVINGN